VCSAWNKDDERVRRVSRNVLLYRAPATVIVYMDKRLSKYDMSSAGLWMQNLTLVLRAQRIESCYIASGARYPGLLQTELGLPENIEVLSGIALGYKDHGHVRNTLALT
jgi:nitroreductase